MTTLYERNFAALKTHHPAIGHALETLTDIPAIQLGKNAHEHMEILCAFADGKSQPYYGVDSPPKHAEALVASWPLKNPRVLIFLGLGLGHHLLEYTAKKASPLTEVILVIEPYAHVFKHALTVNDFTTLFANPRIRWCIGSDLPAVQQFFLQVFTNWHILAFANAIEYAVLPQADALTPKFFAEVRALLPQLVGHCFNRYFSDPFDAFMGAQNTCANLPAMGRMPMFDLAEGKFRGRPGVVIASGPSLHAALPALQTIQDRAVMAVCPSALPLVLQSEIRPHVWLNIERLENQGAFFETLSTYPPHIFVGPPLVHPRCFSGNRGHNALSLGASLHDTWLGLPGKPHELGHSSAHAAFQLLQRLGCDPIFLVGQDLAYEGNDTSHSEGVWESSVSITRQILDAKPMTVEGNSGAQIKTNPFWFGYLQTFRSQILPNYSGKVFHVIAKDRGAKIEGTTRIDPEALIDAVRAEPCDIVATLIAALPNPDAAEIARRRAMWQEKLIRTRDAMFRTIQEASDFSLTAKSFTFQKPVYMHDWDATQPLLHQFVQMAAQYNSRFVRDGKIVPEYRDYIDFLHPIAQGVILRYCIDYYSSGDEIRGDWGEIGRKAEVMHHLGKDEAFWANVAIALINQTLAQLETAK